MVSNIRIFMHERPTEHTYDYHVVTVVDGMIVSDVYHLEDEMTINGPELDDTHIGKLYHPDLYPHTNCETWYDEEVGS